MCQFTISFLLLAWLGFQKKNNNKMDLIQNINISYIYQIKEYIYIYILCILNWNKKLWYIVKSCLYTLNLTQI